MTLIIFLFLFFISLFSRCLAHASAHKVLNEQQERLQALPALQAAAADAQATKEVQLCLYRPFSLSLTLSFTLIP